MDNSNATAAPAGNTPHADVARDDPASASSNTDIVPGDDPTYAYGSTDIGFRYILNGFKHIFVPGDDPATASGSTDIVPGDDPAGSTDIVNTDIAPGDDPAGNTDIVPSDNPASASSNTDIAAAPIAAANNAPDILAPRQHILAAAARSASVVQAALHRADAERAAAARRREALETLKREELQAAADFRKPADTFGALYKAAIKISPDGHCHIVHTFRIRRWEHVVVVENID
ncbi:hypothetical protein HDU86_001524 [Geranomyces michiganensis]|nr:hypothetical protein HDU86_001524 [Geranomyces michiganensis]